MHRSDPFSAVVSFTEYGLLPAAIIGNHLNLPANPIFPVLHTRDKIKMRTLLNNNNLSSVNYKECHSLQDAHDFFHSISNQKMIIKPYSGGGSLGVSLVRDAAEIKPAWERATTSEGSILAEEFLEGKEYSVESMSHNGVHEIVAVTEKLTTDYPHFIEVGHQTPAMLDNKTYIKIVNTTVAFLNLLQQKEGPAHTEVRIVNGIPKIIESQTRMGGDQIWELTELTTGVDVISETVSHLLKLPIKRKKPMYDTAAIRFFCYENILIKAVDGLEEACSYPGILRIKCDLTPGMQLTNLVSSESRQGYILAAGHSKIDAINSVENAFKRIQIIFNSI